MPLPISKDAINFTETKRKIAERAGTLQDVASASTGIKKPGLAGLSFKKNKTVPDLAAKQSPVLPSPSTPSVAKKGPGSLFLPDSQTSPMVDSPVSARGDGWGGSASPATPAAPWGTSGGAQGGSTSWSTDQSWGMAQKSPQQAHFEPTGLLSPSVDLPP